MLMSSSSIERLPTLRQVTMALLDSGAPASSLRPGVLELVEILRGSAADCFTQKEEIASGETQTSSGIALSPTMAAMCAVDYVRTIMFLRGIHDAIIDVRKKAHDRPARILYVGSGPFGTLAVPLMAAFDSSEAQFTILDIHAESVQSVQAVVDSLVLEPSVSDIVATDALTFSIEPNRPPDIIVVETMRACLDAEPQVAITRHLLQQAPDATFVPEEVSIDLMLVDPSREFNLATPDDEAEPVDRDRVPLGSVFVVNRQTVSSWSGTEADVIPGSTVQIPDSWYDRYQPMLFTTICVYQKHIIREYDSGLTCPRSLATVGSIHAGDLLQCSYVLGGDPHLNLRRVDEAEPGLVTLLQNKRMEP